MSGQQTENPKQPADKETEPHNVDEKVQEEAAKEREKSAYD